ncbi:MAG: hypothetical protein PHO84_05615, partial [Dysgonamonadaceae bacterium]|nr:hypothetical protein [Dysgonamonadaceae bacterium]
LLRCTRNSNNNHEQVAGGFDYFLSVKHNFKDSFLNLESQKINSKNLAYAKNKEKLDIQHTVLY